MDWWSVKRFLVGRPLETLRLESERLSKVTGLAVLSSDALSSSAYAAEAMLLVLMAAGTAATRHGIVITGFIVALMALVIMSYRQTVYAYPQGGGASFAARGTAGGGGGLDALPARPGVSPGTGPVSAAAGGAPITSAFPATAS